MLRQRGGGGGEAYINYFSVYTAKLYRVPPYAPWRPTRRSEFVNLNLLSDLHRLCLFATQLPSTKPTPEEKPSVGLAEMSREFVPRMLGEVRSMVDAERSGANRQLVATLMPHVVAEMRGALSGARADCVEATRALQNATAASREAVNSLNEAASARRAPTTPPSRATQLRR